MRWKHLWAEKAMRIAKKAHDGQLDKGGRAYIDHPIAVESVMDTDEEKAVALLHDVIEDTDFTTKHLIQAGLPQGIVGAVDVLTKQKGVSYDAYLAAIRKNPLACKVKRADLLHNSDLSRLPNITEKDLQRNEKYRRALQILAANK